MSALSFSCPISPLCVNPLLLTQSFRFNLVLPFQPCPFVFNLFLFASTPFSRLNPVLPFQPRVFVLNSLNSFPFLCSPVFLSQAVLFVSNSFLSVSMLSFRLCTVNAFLSDSVFLLSVVSRLSFAFQHFPFGRTSSSLPFLSFRLSSFLLVFNWELVVCSCPRLGFRLVGCSWLRLAALEAAWFLAGRPAAQLAGWLRNSGPHYAGILIRSGSSIVLVQIFPY